MTIKHQYYFLKYYSGNFILSAIKDNMGLDRNLTSLNYYIGI